MNRLQALKAIAHGEAIEKGANLAEIMDIGMTALMLHNVLHGRASDDDGPDFETSEMEGLMGAVIKGDGFGTKKKRKPKVRKEERPPAEGKTGLLEQLKQLISTAEAPGADSADTDGTQTIISEVALAKSFDEDKGLITAVVLRPNVTDLHGDIYDSAEVEKACFNFNTRCRQTNVQHEQMADFDIVESYIAKADFELGEGQVLAGDWIATMHIDPEKHEDVWKKVKDGEFTGFSIGCKATVEAIA